MVPDQNLETKTDIDFATFKKGKSQWSSYSQKSTWKGSTEPYCDFCPSVNPGNSVQT